MYCKAIIHFIIPLILFFTGCAQTGKQPPHVLRGVIDLSSWDFEKDGPVKLNGDWEFHWKTFINPADYLAGAGQAQKSYVMVPSLWLPFMTRKYSQFGGLEKGYATYVVKLKGLSTKTGRDLALKINAKHSSYELYFIPVSAAAVPTMTEKKILPLIQNGIISNNEHDAVPAGMRRE